MHYDGVTPHTHIGEDASQRSALAPFFALFMRIRVDWFEPVLRRRDRYVNHEQSRRVGESTSKVGVHNAGDQDRNNSLWNTASTRECQIRKHTPRRGA